MVKFTNMELTEIEYTVKALVLESFIDEEPELIIQITDLIINKILPLNLKTKTE